MTNSFSLDYQFAVGSPENEHSARAMSDMLQSSPNPMRFECHRNDTPYSGPLKVRSSGNIGVMISIGSNSSAVFSCGGATAASQSTNLIILGAPGHRCSLTATGSTAFSLRCQSETGGSCTSSCTR